MIADIQKFLFSWYSGYSFQYKLPNLECYFEHTGLNYWWYPIHLRISKIVLKFPNILDNIVVREHQHKKGKRANKWLYQNTNNIIAGTTGKETQSEILLGIGGKKSKFCYIFACTIISLVFVFSPIFRDNESHLVCNNLNV